MDPLGKNILPELAAKAPDKKVAKGKIFPFFGGAKYLFSAVMLVSFRIFEAL